LRSGQEVVQGWEKRRLYVQALPFVPESVCFPRRKKEEGGFPPFFLERWHDDKIYRRWRNNRVLRPNRPSVAVAGSGTTSLLVEKFTADKYMPSQEFRVLFL